MDFYFATTFNTLYEEFNAKITPLGNPILWKIPLVGGVGTVKPKYFHLFEEIFNFIKLIATPSAYKRDSVFVCEYCHFSILLFGKLTLLLNIRKKIFLYAFFIHSFYNNPIMKIALRFLLAQNVKIIAYSASDREYFRGFNTAAEIIFVPYTSYERFKKTRIIADSSKDTYIFSGGHSNRDFNFVLKCAKKMPATRFLIACSKHSAISEPIPENASVFKDIAYDDFMTMLSLCKFHFLALEKDVGASGQIVTIASMQFGKPTVYPDLNGISQYFNNNVTGVMYKFGDLNSAVSGLSSLVENPERYADLGNSAKREWERSFNPKHFKETVINHCKDFFGS